MSAQAVATAFLSQVPPFRYLDEEALARVVARAEIHFFPKGTRILQRDGPPARYLYVVEKGGVKKAVGDVTLEVVGEGEIFGVLSALEGDRSRLDVIAIEDTVCYAIPGTSSKACWKPSRNSPAFSTSSPSAATWTGAWRSWSGPRPWPGPAGSFLPPGPGRWPTGPWSPAGRRPPSRRPPSS